MAPASEPWIVAMLATNPVLLGWAEQLLGRGEIEAPKRIRGIYCQLPEEGDLPPRPTVCHCDVSPDRLHSTPLAELLAPVYGPINLIIKALGFESVFFMIKPELFKTIYVFRRAVEPRAAGPQPG